MSEQEEKYASVDSTNNDGAVAIAAMKKPAEPVRKPKKLPPFKVLLHNDDVNTFEHVLRSVVRLTAISPKEALLKTLEAHESGVSLLLVTHKERAELYVEQFASLSLIVTMEPAESD